MCLCVEFKKTCLIDVPRTSPERPIIWFQGRPVTESRGRLVYNFWIIVLPVKSRNRYVIQTLLLLKNNFSIKSSVFVLVPWGSSEGPLKVPCRSWTLRPFFTKLSLFVTLFHKFVTFFWVVCHFFVTFFSQVCVFSTLVCEFLWLFFISMCLFFHKLVTLFLLVCVFLSLFSQFVSFFH